MGYHHSCGLLVTWTLLFYTHLTAQHLSWLVGCSQSPIISIQYINDINYWLASDHQLVMRSSFSWRGWCLYMASWVNNKHPTSGWVNIQTARLASFMRCEEPGVGALTNNDTSLLRCVPTMFLGHLGHISSGMWPQVLNHAARSVGEWTISQVIYIMFYLPARYLNHSCIYQLAIVPNLIPQVVKPWVIIVNYWQFAFIYHC